MDFDEISCAIHTNELTLGEYQSPQAVQVKLSIYILSFPRHNLKHYTNEVF